MQTGAVEMEMSTEKLRSMAAQAFDLGYDNSAELKDQLIEELVVHWMTSKTEEQQYRIFKVEELRQMPVGALFQHSTRGRCWIELKPDGVKHMRFENANSKEASDSLLPINMGTGKTVSLSIDSEPWDRPMRLLHKEGS